MIKRLIAGTMALFYSIAGFAATTAATSGKHPAVANNMIYVTLILVAIFYFLIIRPQSKKQRAHKALISQVAIGDEIVTTAGIHGKIMRLRDSHIVVSIAKGIEITLLRNAIMQILPKGTIDDLN